MATGTEQLLWNGVNALSGTHSCGMQQYTRWSLVRARVCFLKPTTQARHPISPFYLWILPWDSGTLELACVCDSVLPNKKPSTISPMNLCCLAWDSDKLDLVCVCMSPSLPKEESQPSPNHALTARPSHPASLPLVMGAQDTRLWWVCVFPKPAPRLASTSPHLSVPLPH